MKTHSAYYLVLVLFTVVLTGCDGPREKQIQRLDEFEARVKKTIDKKVLQEWANSTICKYKINDGVSEETFPSCFSNVMDHGFWPGCYITESTVGDKCVDIYWRWIHGYAGIVIGVENKHFTVDWLKDGMESRYLSTNLIIYVN